MDTSIPQQSPVLAQAAREVAIAEDGRSAAAAALDRAQGEVSAVEQRIASLTARRAAIAERRTAGHVEPDDAGEVALIAADLDGLSNLLREAVTVRADAQKAFETAGDVSLRAAFSLTAAERDEAEQLLVKHAGELDARMLLVIDELAKIGKVKQHRRPIWGTSAKLRDAIRTLAFQRSEM